MYCLCVNVYCHRVSTQLQLTNISIYFLSKIKYNTNVFTCVSLYYILLYLTLKYCTDGQIFVVSGGNMQLNLKKVVSAGILIDLFSEHSTNIMGCSPLNQ
jgi:hypothetical protein